MEFTNIRNKWKNITLGAQACNHRECQSVCAQSNWPSMCANVRIGQSRAVRPRKVGWHWNWDLGERRGCARAQHRNCHGKLACSIHQMPQILNFLRTVGIQPVKLSANYYQLKVYRDTVTKDNISKLLEFFK